MTRAPATALGIPSASSGALRPAILVVDDVEGNLIAMDALLADLECDVVLARSGNQALRLMLKRECAVALLDVQMPEMDGFEVARHARQNPTTRDVPLLFLTATHDSDEGVLRGYGSGAVDFLFKPIDSIILRSKVRVFLDLYRTRSEIAAQKRALESAYQELKATQSQLVQSAKMASLGELVAGMAQGRTSTDQTSCFLNLTGIGLQFTAAGAALYRKAREAGRGRELPTEWFTEDVLP